MLQVARTCEGCAHKEYQEGDSSSWIPEKIADGKLDLCAIGTLEEFAAICNS